MQIVAGAGLGISYDPLELSGVPGKACLQLFTTEPVSKSVAINYAIAAYGVSALSDPDIPVITIHTGPIDLLANRFRMRPAPGGVSAGHNNIGAGTAGCLCRGLSEPRNQRLMILSNNHVFANVNNATIGDAIVQPGIMDGGNVTTDQIGLLEDFAPIDFKAANYVDCATAWVNPSDVRPELVYMSNGIPTYFNLSPNHVNAQPGMTVGKCGRTTQLTRISHLIGKNEAVPSVK